MSEFCSAGIHMNVDESKKRRPKAGASVAKDSKHAWRVCLGAFITRICLLGLLHSFGVFVMEFSDVFQVKQADAAWVGTIAYGLSMMLSPLASYLSCKHGYRAVMVSGSLLCSLGCFMSSFSTTFAHLIVFFSIPYGLGASLATTCTLNICHEFFEVYTYVSMGILVSGNSIGTLVVTPSADFLIQNMGWSYTLRVYVVVFILCAICNWWLSPSAKDESLQVAHQANKYTRGCCSLWREPTFILLVSAITCATFGSFVPYIYLIQYAIDCQMNEVDATHLFIILGASTTASRLLVGKLLEWSGNLSTTILLSLSLTCGGVATLILPHLTSLYDLTVQVCIAGVLDGCYNVILPLLVYTFFGADRNLAAWGILNGVSSFSFIVGPPLVGLVVHTTNSYVAGFTLAGVPVIIGGLMICVIPFLLHDLGGTPPTVLASNGEDVTFLSADDGGQASDTHQFYRLREFLPTGEFNNITDNMANRSLQEFPETRSVFSSVEFVFHNDQRELSDNVKVDLRLSEPELETEQGRDGDACASQGSPLTITREALPPTNMQDVFPESAAVLGGFGQIDFNDVTLRSTSRYNDEDDLNNECSNCGRDDDTTQSDTSSFDLHGVTILSHIIITQID